MELLLRKRVQLNKNLDLRSPQIFKLLLTLFLINSSIQFYFIFIVPNHNIEYLKALYTEGRDL